MTDYGREMKREALDLWQWVRTWGVVCCLLIALLLSGRDYPIASGFFVGVAIIWIVLGTWAVIRLTRELQ